MYILYFLGLSGIQAQGARLQAVSNGAKHGIHVDAARKSGTLFQTADEPTRHALGADRETTLRGLNPI